MPLRSLAGIAVARMAADVFENERGAGDKI
jgi:hypothetical protein